MLREFKEFALQGSVLEIAVGLIIGAAFGKVISSLVNDIVMPPIGLLVGDVDFSNLFISLSGRTYASLAEAKAAGAPTLNYGLFFNNILDFLIVALAIFMLIRQFNRLKRQRPAAAPATKECPRCLSTIALRASRCPHCTSELKIA